MVNVLQCESCHVLYHRECVKVSESYLTFNNKSNEMQHNYFKCGACNGAADIECWSFHTKKDEASNIETYNDNFFKDQIELLINENKFSRMLYLLYFIVYI